MSREVGSRLRAVLTLPSSEDEAVNQLVSEIAPRVWWAVVDVEDLSPDKAEMLQADLNHVLHWAIHIGQGAWRLLNAHPEPPAPDKASTDWELALDDLYFDPFVMLDTDEMFHRLMRATDLRRQPLWASPPRLALWARNAPFTYRRLAVAREQGRQADVSGSTSSTLVPVFQQLVSHLYANARLYIEFLERLASSRRKKRVEISDCFINLCALALSMSGDAMRLLWPI